MAGCHASDPHISKGIFYECRAKNIEAVLPMFVNFSDVVTVKNRAVPSDSS